METKSKCPFLGFYHYGVILTYLSVVAAIIGIYFSVGGNKEPLPYVGVICLLISGLCDAFDGAVARTRKNRSREDLLFGERIDSLSDLIAFGVAPTAIMFGMGINRWFYLPIFVFYALCALIRLAYFDVTEIIRTEKVDCGKRTYYDGLPVTNAAVIIPICFLIATMFNTGSIGYTATMLIGYSIVGFAFIFKFKLPKIGVKTIIKILLGVAIILAILLFLNLKVFN